MSIRYVSLRIARFKWSAIISRTREAARVCFGKYLLATNVTISTTLSGVGDTLQQQYEIWTGDDPDQVWDRKRSYNMSVTGAVVGVICHYWYIYLDRRLPGRAFSTVMKKLLVDQIAFSPFLITVFFGTAGVLENSR